MTKPNESMQFSMIGNCGGKFVGEDMESDDDLSQTMIMSFKQPKSAPKTNLNHKRQRLENPAADARVQLRPMFPEAEENEIETAISTTVNLDQVWIHYFHKQKATLPLVMHQQPKVECIILMIIAC